MDTKDTLLQWFLNFFIKKFLVVVLKMKLFETSNQQKKQKITQTNYQKNNKSEVQLTFRDNIWGANLADMQLIGKFNKGVSFLLCLIDVSSKYTWVIPLKDKRGITITNAFQKILDESNWVDWAENGQIKAVSFTID